MTLALEAWSLSLCTAREVPKPSLKWFKWVLEEKPYVYTPASREQVARKKVKGLCRKGFANCILHSRFLPRTWVMWPYLASGDGEVYCLAGSHLLRNNRKVGIKGHIAVSVTMS